MLDADWEVDLVGTQCDPGNYADYLGREFDRNHEGRGGWTSGQIREKLGTWLAETGPPDIVLFSSPGGNDALTGVPVSEAIANIDAIVGALQQANPQVTILIEQLAPGRSDLMSPELADVFLELQDAALDIAAARSSESSAVVPVDMATGFTDSLLADDVHYNQAGAEFIALRYFQVLEEVISTE